MTRNRLTEWRALSNGPPPVSRARKPLSTKGLANT